MQLLRSELDFNLIRRAVCTVMYKSLGLTQNQVIEEEGEEPNFPRPKRFPYMGFKITSPGGRYGDDAKQTVLDSLGQPTTKVRSFGPRRMTMIFNAYGKTHEDAYNLMMLWQSALDEELVIDYLNSKGISVSVIGGVADLSALLNTGYEGRAHLDCTFLITAGVTSDLGEIETVSIQGEVATPQEIVDIDIEETF